MIRILLSLVLFFSLLSQSATGQPLLKGRIEHRNKLQQLENQYAAGTKIDVTSLRKLTPNNFWFRIPDWSSGSWKCDNHTVYYRYLYQTQSKTFDVESYSVRGRGDETWGIQKDSTGNIWQYQSTNYWTVGEGSRAWDLSFVREYDPIKITDSEVVIVFYSTKLIVNKLTQRVIRSFQSESVQTYSPAPNGLRKVDVSIKLFDYFGNPLLLTKLIAIDTKVKSFEPVDVDNKGRSMKSLFAEYLASHGMKDLIPKDKTKRPQRISKSMQLNPCEQ